MSFLFNAVAGLGFLLVPQAYSTMFPREIRQAAAPFVEKKDIRTMNLILHEIVRASSLPHFATDLTLRLYRRNPQRAYVPISY